MSLLARYCDQSVSAHFAPTRRRAGWLLGLGGCVALTSLSTLGACTFGSGPDHTGDNAPRSEPLPSALSTSKPLTLVLSSGGPRGFVHVGVIEALDELGVRPQLVVGASVGALIGVLYCGGMNGKALHALALDLGMTKFAYLAIGANERFSGAPIARRVNRALADRPLQALNPRCAVVAVDRVSRTPVTFTYGDAGIAVQASAAIPGQFVPVSIRSRLYEDPDLVVPMPVRLARSLGAGTVISVDASAHEDRPPPGAERFRQGDQRKRALTTPDAKAANLNLHPDFGYWVNFSTEFRERAMRAGYTATMRQADAIKALAATSPQRKR